MRWVNIDALKKAHNHSGCRLYNGDGGIRTRVQRSWYKSFYVCSLYFSFAQWKVIDNQRYASLIGILLNRLQTAVFSISYSGW